MGYGLNMLLAQATWVQSSMNSHLLTAWVCPTERQAQRSVRLLEQVGFFVVGNLALHPNGAQVVIQTTEET